MGKLSIFIGGIVPFCLFYNSCLISVKAQISQLLLRVIPIVVFVWRQLEFAFFGALTSVGALFYFLRKEE